MNVLPSSPAPAAVGAPGTPARANPADAAEPGAFAEVLGHQLQRATRARDHDTAPVGARGPIRSAARKANDPAERETQEANALPLVAAALESRSLAQPAAEAAASTDAAASAPGAQAAQADARTTRRGLPAAVESASAPQADAAGALAATTPGPETGLRQVAARELSAPSSVSGAPVATAAAARPASQQATPERAEEGAPHAAPHGERAAAPVAAQEAGQTHEPVHASARDEPSTSTGAVATPAPASTNAVAAAPAPAQGYVAPMVATRTWGPALGQEVARIHQAGHGQAQLELNPPGLGPLSVSLSVADQQAHAVFVSPHPAVRAAVEAALPQLRSALADNGISLGQASVGAEHQPGSGAFSQSAQDQAPQRRWATAPSFAAPDRAATLPVAPRRTGAHMLDTFA